MRRAAAVIPFPTEAQRRPRCLICLAPVIRMGPAVWGQAVCEPCRRRRFLLLSGRQP